MFSSVKRSAALLKPGVRRLAPRNERHACCVYHAKEFLPDSGRDSKQSPANCVSKAASKSIISSPYCIYFVVFDVPLSKDFTKEICIFVSALPPNLGGLITADVASMLHAAMDTWR